MPCVGMVYAVSQTNHNDFTFVVGILASAVNSNVLNPDRHSCLWNVVALMKFFLH